MTVEIYHTNGKLTRVSNLKKLCFWKDRSITQVSADNIDQFLLDQVNDRLSITFIGDSVVTILKENIESLVFTD